MVISTIIIITFIVALTPAVGYGYVILSTSQQQEAGTQTESRDTKQYGSDSLVMSVYQIFLVVKKNSGRRNSPKNPYLLSVSFCILLCQQISQKVVQTRPISCLSIAKERLAVLALRANEAVFVNNVRTCCDKTKLVI